MNRKDEHIEYALKQGFVQNDFDKIRIIYDALPSIAYDEINLEAKFCGFKFDYPIYINAMTGGSLNAKEINDRLSKLAAHFNIPIASGSLSIALKNKEVVDSFRIIRENNPKGIVMANIGADKTLKDAIEAIEILNANILQIHLNVVQEMIMPEGDRNFKYLEENIKEIVQNVKVPVIVKEVGFGMSLNTLEKLKSLGVKTIDISGSGGTNFAIIENARREEAFVSLNNFGISTVESLLETKNISGIDILASGGIRNPLDVIKALILGAKAVGMSKYFLNIVTNYSMEEAIKSIEKFIIELKSIMTILGKRKINELRDVEIVLSSDLESYIRQRK